MAYSSDTTYQIFKEIILSIHLVKSYQFSVIEKSIQSSKNFEPYEEVYIYHT